MACLWADDASALTGSSTTWGSGTAWGRCPGLRTPCTLRPTSACRRWCPAHSRLRLRLCPSTPPQPHLKVLVCLRVHLTCQVCLLSRHISMTLPASFRGKNATRPDYEHHTSNLYAISGEPLRPDPLTEPLPFPCTHTHTSRFLHVHVGSAVTVSCSDGRSSLHDLREVRLRLV